ncbi:uncharacterized protein LOC135155782 [Lytechinus pictus]|uniref:uncharacterized protein LOC135155782 n=1 Tax=Lytechinus pictus TaxID=7653 RepID=UPI0030B9DD69
MSQSVEEMVSVLTRALQGLNIQRAPPPVKLSKFKGPPKVAGDLSLEEWLEEFSSYTTHYQLSGEAKAQSLVDHLAGVAKEEVLCRDEDVRKDSDQIINVLQSLFAASESVPSLSQSFYNRRQQEGESLADYSRALMRLYDRMEKAASSTEDKNALKRLKDSSLKERFVCGAKEKWVQRELRRIEMSSKSKNFLEMRSEVLEFFSGQEPRSSPRVHEVYAERADMCSSFPKQEKEQEQSDVKAELADLRREVAQIAKSVQALTQYTQTPKKIKKKLKCYNCLREGHTKKDCTEEVVCFNCHQTGHMGRECPKKSTVSNHPTSETSASPTSHYVPTANLGTVGPAESKEKANSNLVERFVAKSPCCNILIGGVEIGCVVDTGAEASIIPLSLYESKLKCRIGELQKSEGIFLHVIGVGGVELPIVGYVGLPIKVKGEELMGNFLVVSDRAPTVEHMRYPILLGSNILQHIAEYKPLYDKLKKESRNQEQETDVHIGSVRIYTVIEDTLPQGVEIKDLDPVEETAVASLLHKHKNVFSKGSYDVGVCDLIPHEIRLTEGPDIRLPYRRIHTLQVKEVKEMLQGMVDQKIIRPSKSSFASPIVLVRKKDGSLRLCIDYRKLNDRTVKDSFPLPRIEETLEALSGSKYFSTLDLAHGYFQVVMDKDSIDKTAFRVPWGLYEFMKMPQCLTNSPSTFQRVMECILGDLNLSQILLYLDDILIFSETFEEHLRRLDTVLSRLHEHGLKVKGKKCDLFQREVRYLGHIVSNDGIAVDQDKVERVATWPVPKNAKELRSFLGLASYYRRFIPNFSKIAAPLHALTGSSQKGKKREQATFKWDDEEETAFQELKRTLTTAPVLAHPRFDRNFIIEVDASTRGLGACLLQENDGKVHPVAYASRGLRGSEKKYPDLSSFKLELLALKWAVTDKFGPYIQGSLAHSDLD